MLLKSFFLGLLYFLFLDSQPKAGLTCVTNIISTQDVSHLIPFSQPLLFGPSSPVTFISIRKREREKEREFFLVIMAA